jgi:predicted glycoside hydrolase/deacetylase ChbG (UPF0249 family)
MGASVLHVIKKMGEFDKHLDKHQRGLDKHQRDLDKLKPTRHRLAKRLSIKVKGTGKKKSKKAKRASTQRTGK